MRQLARKVKRKVKEGTLVDSIKIKIYSRFYFNLDKNYDNAIFLAGTGRSGTTWISNIINYDNSFRYLFEPFHSYRVGICKDFKYRQYLRPENNDVKYLEPATKILSGNIRDKWIDRFNKKFLCRQRLVKDIRANLMLKWIKTHFPEIKIVFLMRHPGAVANSRLKLNWKSNLDTFLSQPELFEDFLNPFKREILNAKTEFEKSIFLWCIENYVPLKQFSKGEIHVSFYEKFAVSPEEEIVKLFEFLGRRYDQSIYKVLKKPSPEVRKESALISGGSMIDKWRESITKEQLDKMIDILSLFELDSIYSYDSMPNVDKVKLV
ncbi:MAG: sulfotransferase domain-containing protein [Candidatus Heimdallarchaeaceae archaeon]